jgi:hypothetical protein
VAPADKRGNLVVRFDVTDDDDACDFKQKAFCGSSII